MHGGAGRQLADTVMTGLASLVTHVFFRHVEVEGADNLPRRGPLIVVANHSNGLVDGLLLMTTLRRYPRFLGKSTLFRIVPLRPFLKLAGVVPVYRRSDAHGSGGDEGPDRNEASFRTSRELLARGGVVALFPEGISHNEVALQPLRTGAARIALGAADEGTESVATVAVGLVYDAKATFRSRALVRVGPARPVVPSVDEYRQDPREAVRTLTDQMAQQLHGVVTTYRSWQDAEMLAGIADLVVTPGPGPAPGKATATADSAPDDPAPDDPAPDDSDPDHSDPDHSDPDQSAPALADRERVAAALNSLDLDATPGGRALEEAYQAYRRDLRLMGVTDAQVTRRYGRRYQRALAWSLFKVAVALPPGLVGAVVHAVPYQVMKRVGKLPRDESIKSTVKLLGCFGLFTTEYLIIAEVVRRKWGLMTAACAFVAAPLSGYATLRLSERVKSAGGLIEGARIVRSRRTLLPSVLAQRAEVIRRAEDLVLRS
jgi:1-acyl-sn-glycerol-3-phosphate acyltransferase